MMYSSRLNLYRFSFLSLLYFVMGCNHRHDKIKGSEWNGPLEVLELSPKPFEDLKTSGYKMEDIELIPLETKWADKAFVNTIGDLLIKDSLMYIVDKNSFSINIFNVSGKYVNKIYKVGKGEDEYISLEDVKINPATGNIEVLTNTGRKLIRYSPEGEYLNYETLSCPALMNFEIIGSNYFFYKGLQVCEDELQNENGYRLIGYLDRGRKMESEFSFLPFSFSGKNTPYSTVFDRNLVPLPLHNDTLRLVEQISDTVYSLTSNSCVPRYLLNFVGEVGKKQKILNNKDILNKSEEIVRQRLTYPLSWLENRDYLFIQYSYFSYKDNGRLISSTFYDKRKKIQMGFSEFHRFQVSWNDLPVIFDKSFYPQFVDPRSGKFIVVIQPYELTDQTMSGGSRSNLLKLIKAYRPGQIAEFSNPILLLFNISK